MTRTHMITETEALIVIEADKLGRHLITETPVFGVARKAGEVLDELDDSAVRILRIAADMSTAPEDITEECARQYLYRMDEKEEIEIDEELRFPAYVRDSRAWALWRDDIAASAPVALYSTRNHETQGLRRAGA